MPLAGLVLHASRCGSTLLLAALGARPGVVTVDEPPALDAALLRVRESGGTEQLARVLAELGEAGEHVVVKTDAWHALELPRLLAIVPGVPWVFVHRDPVEILVSHRREPGSHTVPGILPQAWFGPPAAEVDLASYAASVVRRIFDSVVPHAGPDHLVAYDEIRDALPRVAERFGLPTEVDEERLAVVVATHAKRPYQAFVDDRAAKQAAADQRLRALVATEIAPAYDALLARAGQAVA